MRVERPATRLAGVPSKTIRPPPWPASPGLASLAEYAGFPVIGAIVATVPRLPGRGGRPERALAVLKQPVRSMPAANQRTLLDS